MKAKGLKLVPPEGCPDGYHPNTMRCPDSKSWCEQNKGGTGDAYDEKSQDQVTGTLATGQPLMISAHCKLNISSDSKLCRFMGEDLFFDITITNTQNSEVGFPLDYLKKTGPIILLRDGKTKGEFYLRTNLADPDLLEKFTVIRPGESVVLESVIKSSEVQQLDGYLPAKDLTAEVTVKAKIQMKGELVDFSGVDTLKVMRGEK